MEEVSIGLSDISPRHQLARLFLPWEMNQQQTNSHSEWPTLV